MMKKIYLSVMIISSLYMLNAMNLQAQSPENSERQDQKTALLTYEAYMSTLKEKLPEIRKNHLAVERAQNNVLSVKAGGDYNLDSSFTYDSETPASTNPAMSMDSQDSYTLSAGVSKKVLQSGTELSTGLGYSSTSVKSRALGLNSTYHSPSLYVTVSQPVLKNAFGLVDRYALKNADMNVMIEKITEEENNKSTLNYYRKLYYNWIQYSRHIEGLKASIDNARILYEQLKRKEKAGLADNDDVQDVYSLLLGYKDQYREAVAAYESIVKELAIFIDIEKYRPDELVFDNFFKEALVCEYSPLPFSQTRLSEIYRLTKQYYNNNLMSVKNELLPELNIEGSVTLKSQEDTFSRSFENMHDVDYSVGFSLSYPLCNREAESREKEVELDIIEINKQYEESRNTYLKNLEYIRATIAGSRDRFTLKEEKLKALKSKYKTEEKKYNQARLKLSYMVDTANSITSEKVALIDFKSEVIGLYIDYLDLVE